MAVSSTEAAKYLLKLDAVASSFEGFVNSLYPDFTLAPFQKDLITALDKLERGDLKNDAGKTVHRLMINMPPRHGKSWLASTLFPVYYLAKRPNREVLATSYNADLAKTFGRQVRDHAIEQIISKAFPDFSVSDEARAVDDWMTTERGRYYATGIGGATTGRAANLLLIDDPVKAREEAESATYRNKVWSYYISALLTRKQPEPDGTPPIEIMILTRWHPDDPAGRLQETEDWSEGEWKHINLPAITESATGIKTSCKELPPDDPRHIPADKLIREVPPYKRHFRQNVKSALWPARFPVEDLEKIERRDPREFASLYQQSPFIKGGNLIKSSWWQTTSDWPEEFTTTIIAADTAFKKNETADYSVLMTAATDVHGDIFILDVHRERYTFPELKRALITKNTLLRGKGLRGIYIEDKASGQSLIQELKSQSGMAVIPYRVGHTDKVARVNTIIPLIEGGRVYLPKEAPWLDDFISECTAFPSAKHDDQVDALAIALDVISRQTALSPDTFRSSLNVRASLNNMAKTSLASQLGSRTEEFYSTWGE